MAQANYPACVEFVRKQEGGNTDTPGDRGGRTGRGGITHATYDAYRARKGLPKQDVWLISDAEITEIYAAEYWAPVHGGDLPDGIDLCLFDFAINSGPAKANQERLLAGSGDAPTLIRKICTSRLSFMRSLGSWRQFGADWGRRVSECEALALKMAGSLTPAHADAAAQAKDTEDKKTARIVTSGIVATGAGVHFWHFGAWALTIIAGLTALGAAIAIFNAWRHSQRADALTAAVQQMQAAQKTASAAYDAAAAQAKAKEAAIAAEQAALAEAKCKIDQALSGSPLNPPAPIVAAQPSATK